MKKIKKKWIKIRIPSFTALIIAAVLALTACSGCGGDAETPLTTTTATKTTGESTTEAVTTKKQANKETTTKAEKATETATTKAGGNTEETTQAQAYEPVTEAPGHDEPGTTAHQHSWMWVEPVTHVETIYESVYHPPVTHEWTHNVVDGSQNRCLRCWSVFLDCKECVDHCIECGGSMRTEDHYTEVTDTIIDQEEYWSEEPVGTKVVTDSEGYWRCSGCGSLK